MFFRRSPFRASLCASLFAAATLTGCSNLQPTATSTSATTLTGNWQFSSSQASAAKLPSLSGELTGTTASLTGILHSDASTACISPTASFEVSGSTSAQGVTTITGTNVAGGTLTLTGTLTANGKSFSDASYTVTGGTCAFANPAAAVAQAFSPISGTYNGTFSDPSGQVITLTGATLTQSPTSTPNGDFTLSGSATFNNPCFSNSVSVSNTQVTGGSFTLTYADPNTLNSVVVSGNFSQDGTTLTVTNWTLTGSCGPDAGTGIMTQQ